MSVCVSASGVSVIDNLQYYAFELVLSP